MLTLKKFSLSLLALSLVLNAGILVAQDDTDMDDLLIDARSDFQSQDFETAATKLKKYTKAVDDNGEAWYMLGYALHMNKEIESALVAHKRAADDPQFRAVSLYNVGCALSLLEQTEESLVYLHKAMDSGFDRFEMLDSDDDLINVRKVDGFKELKARAENGGKRLDKKPDSNSLVGEWKIVSGMRAGEKVGTERLPPVVKVTEKDFTMPAGDDAFVMSYKVVKTKDEIMALDFNIESGPAPEGKALAIMKVDGGKAKLCYDPMGQNRPEEFETTEENGFFMFVMEKQKAAAPEAPKVDGTWQVTKGVRAGEEVPDERLELSTITFKDSKITIPAGEEAFVMSYKINTKTSPMQIDMKVESGPAPDGSAAVGIIKMEDGKFSICYNAMGSDRPEKFESSEENGFFFFEMKKAK